LLGEVQQANDAEEAAPVWVGNVGSLVKARRRQRQLERLHERVREYVYYPGTFVPLAGLLPTITGMSNCAPSIESSAPAPMPEKLASASSHSSPAKATNLAVSRASSIEKAGGMGRLGMSTLGGRTETQTPVLCASGSLPDSGAGLPAPRSASESAQSVDESQRVVAFPQDRCRLNGHYKVHFYGTELSGAPSRAIDGAGNVLWSIRYGGWGAEEHTEVGSFEFNVRLQGQYRDEETGFCHNRNRYFDPRIGSFISQDPLGLDAGPGIYEFSYNSQTYCDPLGLSYRRTTASDGRTVYQNDDLFNPDRKVRWTDQATGEYKYGTNLERMAEGYAPIGKDGRPVQLHHLTMTEAPGMNGRRGSLAEIKESTHQKHTSILHIPFPRNPNNRRQTLPRYPSFRMNADGTPSVLSGQFDAFRTSYWKARAAAIIACRQ
jgi:RHS repeat-associated protein